MYLSSTYLTTISTYKLCSRVLSIAPRVVFAQFQFPSATMSNADKSCVVHERADDATCSTVPSFTPVPIGRAARFCLPQFTTGPFTPSCQRLPDELYAQLLDNVTKVTHDIIIVTLANQLLLGQRCVYPQRDWVLSVQTPLVSLRIILMSVPSISGLRAADAPCPERRRLTRVVGC